MSSATARCLFVSLLAATGAQAGTVLNVPGDYATIQEALDAAVSGDEIVVAQGTYMVDTTIVVPPKAITLRSVTDDPMDTILDGSLLPKEVTSPIIDVVGDAPGARTIRGFNVVNGPSAVIIRTEATRTVRLILNRFGDNGPWGCVRALGLDVEITDNIFSGNATYLFGATNIGGNATVTGNTYLANDAIVYQSNLLTQGGAIYFIGINGRTGLTAEVRDNLFVGNTCTDYGGAIHVGGWTGVATVEDNRFFENVAGACAGGIYEFGSVTVLTIRNNLFVRNDSPAGSAIALENIEGAMIVGNTLSANVGGPALKLANTTTVSVERNLVAFNEGPGIMITPGATGTILTCNDAYGNVGGDYPRGAAGGNISEDPLFCGATTDDYTLAENSPCLPAGNACGVQMGVRPSGCEAQTPTVDVSWGTVKARFAGH